MPMIRRRRRRRVMCRRRRRRRGRRRRKRLVHHLIHPALRIVHIINAVQELIGHAVELLALGAVGNRLHPGTGSGTDRRRQDHIAMPACVILIIKPVSHFVGLPVNPHVLGMAGRNFDH